MAGRSPKLKHLTQCRHSSNQDHTSLFVVDEALMMELIAGR